MQDKIWLSSPHMGGTEQNYINEAFAENWILITYVCCSRTTKNFVFKLDWRSLVLLKLFS